MSKITYDEKQPVGVPLEVNTDYTYGVGFSMGDSIMGILTSLLSPREICILISQLLDWLDKQGNEL